MKDRFLDVEQRVRRYWHLDGIGELVGGGAFLLLGLYFAGLEWFASNSLMRTLLDSSLLILMGGGGYVAQRAVNVLKTRLTYPRTGYVDYGASRNRSWLGSLLTGAIALGPAILLVVLSKFTGSFNWLPGFTGLVLGITLLIIFARQQVTLQPEPAIWIDWRCGDDLRCFDPDALPARESRACGG